MTRIHQLTAFSAVVLTLALIASIIAAMVMK
jgi:hypothetical protein